MQSKRSWIVATVLSGMLLVPVAAHAATYPTNICVSGKQRAAATFCRASLAAWAIWERNHDTGKRDSAITKAGQRLAAAWATAETAAARKAVDCADTTLSASGMQTLVEGAAAVIAGDVNSGLDLAGNRNHANCGAAMLAAAATDCSALLNAEAGYIVRPIAGTTRRNLAQTSARNRFLTAFARATARNCPTTATAPAIGTRVDALAADMVSNTIMSPNVDNTQFITIAPPVAVSYQGQWFNPTCSRGTPYYFFAKRGSVNKLVMYYQGGGACWDYLTCRLGTFDQSVDPTGSDNPNNQQSGFGDLSNPNNPFKDWNIVFTSYCTGDIHFGDVHQDYDNGGGLVEHVNHFGYENARVVEKWAREHFVNPDEVFVTGSSAGAYGALFNAPLLHPVWPDSKFSVLADAGNGVSTADFILNDFPAWQFEKNVPAKIPGALDAIRNGSGTPAYTQAVAAYFPRTAWANYTTAYDGSSGGQTGFYHIQLTPSSPLQWLNWWHATCEWHDLMLQQAQETAAAVTTGNYRYYIGRGSRHTGWGSDTVVYNDDPIGGTPALNDWTTAMRNRDAGWVNVECTDCETTLSGDPLPSPLQAPFQQVGPDVEIVCP